MNNKFASANTPPLGKGIPSLEEYNLSDTGKFLLTSDRYERSVIDVAFG